MNNKPENKRSITDPIGKKIFNDTVAFRVHFKASIEKKHSSFPYKIEGPFKEAIQGQKRFASIFLNAFKSGPSCIYSKDYLHHLWPWASIYKRLHQLFLYQPAFSEPFLNRIDQYFYQPVIWSWRETQKISCFSKSSDYYAWALPGTSSKARGNALELGVEHLNQAKGVIPEKLGNELADRYTNLFSKRWQQFGGSLFPLGYRSGDKHYGRLRSVPGSTLSNMDHGVKETILQGIKTHVGLSFMEVDFKSCHGVIFEDLFDWDKFNRSDLPTLNQLWPEMIKDFWAIADEIVIYPHIWKQVESWGDQLLKGLLKNQFYKALNGGQPDYCEDNVERSWVKLKIAKEDQEDFNSYLHTIFSQMKVFTLETNFKEQLNSFPLLYLPNTTQGFPINTLSKKQSRALLANPEACFRQQTANSRLFSNMELCLIMHLYASITACELDWLVVGYEADGILVAGYFTEEEAVTGIKRLNETFKESIKGLTTANHELDFKNFV